MPRSRGGDRVLVLVVLLPVLPVIRNCLGLIYLLRGDDNLTSVVEMMNDSET
jgi:hypothetical protein